MKKAKENLKSMHEYLKNCKVRNPEVVQNLVDIKILSETMDFSLENYDKDYYQRHNPNKIINKSFTKSIKLHKATFEQHKNRIFDFQRDKHILNKQIQNEPYINIHRLHNMLWDSHTKRHLNKQAQQSSYSSKMSNKSIHKKYSNNNYFNPTSNQSLYESFDSPVKNMKNCRENSASRGKKYIDKEDSPKMIKDPMSNSFYKLKSKVSLKDIYPKNTKKENNDDEDLYINSKYAYSIFADIDKVESMDKYVRGELTQNGSGSLLQDNSKTLASNVQFLSENEDDDYMNINMSLDMNVVVTSKGMGPKTTSSMLDEKRDEEIDGYIDYVDEVIDHIYMPEN